MSELPTHSPLGASGAYRWMVCPGSVTYSEGVSDTESEFAALGTAAHAVAAHTLEHDLDAWQMINFWVTPEDKFTKEGLDGDFLIDTDMANAVQVYLDHVRHEHPDRNQGNFWVERRFHCPQIHRLFYGTADCVYFDAEARTLHVWDYKHGAGIVVEVQDNPQCKYYAIGALTDLDLWDAVDMVVLHIAQPRAWHYGGKVRSWSITTEKLEAWCDDVLVPAMDRALESTETLSGDHCRFCPARSRACPQLMADYEELEQLLETMKKKGGAPELTNIELGRLLDLSEIVKVAAKAALETGYARANVGAEIPNWKLAKARANRAWKDGALDEAIDQFGEKAMTEPQLKSPAQIDDMPKGKAFTTEWAVKPEAGLQLVKASDSRAEQSPKTKSMFKSTAKKGGKRKAPKK